MENQEDYYKAILGPKNQDYYLRRFAKFDQAGKAGAGWHWPAFFVTFYWLLYRKMWVPALLYFFLPYIFMVGLGIVAAMAGQAAGAIVGFGYLVYAIVIFVWYPMYANALYYKQCRNRIAEVRASSNIPDRQLGELAGKGGTSNIALIFILIFAFVAILGILAAVAIPAYQDYITRARMVEAVSAGTKASEKVAEYYYQHQAPPGSLADAGFEAHATPAIKEMSVNGQNGIISITMGSGPVYGKALLFVPSVGPDNKIVWQCMSQEIMERYLPAQCRQPKQ